MPIRPLSGVLARLGHGLREALREGYGRRELRADVLAGLVVGVVALPLAMALAIASGAPPQNGLYTSIVAGVIVAAAGGSRVSVSGPTAAFVVLLVPVSSHFGLGGLLVASLMAGMILVALGVARLGRLIRLVPYPVTTGFTAGIGVVIATLQLKDFFGLSIERMPEHFHEKVTALVSAAPTLRWQEFAVGAAALAILLLWPKLTKAVPSPLVAMLATAIGAEILRRTHGFEVATIGSRFSYTLNGATFAGIPRLPPHFDWPWNFPGPDGAPLGLSYDMIKALVGPAFAIAALGAIESLLCAVVADGMTGTRHDPDVELAAQGLGNIVAPFFGGFAATGAIARTATGIRAGARSPVSSIVHSLFVLAAVVVLAPYLAYLPMASLAALLLLVAWNMCEARHFVHVLRVAPRGDVAVLVTCFGLTVAFDMVVSVSVGMILAAFLFMQRMSELSGAKISEDLRPHLADPHLAGVVVYQIGGPLFFGAAEKATSTLARVSSGTRAVILQMDDVPAMDMTGLVALESSIQRLHRAHIFVAIAGVQPQPRAVLAKAGLRADAAKLAICGTDDEAVAAVRAHLATLAQSASAPPTTPSA